MGNMFTSILKGLFASSLTASVFLTLKKCENFDLLKKSQASSSDLRGESQFLKIRTKNSTPVLRHRWIFFSQKKKTATRLDPWEIYLCTRKSGLGLSKFFFFSSFLFFFFLFFLFFSLLLFFIFLFHFLFHFSFIFLFLFLFFLLFLFLFLFFYSTKFLHNSYFCPLLFFFFLLPL